MSIEIYYEHKNIDFNQKVLQDYLRKKVAELRGPKKKINGENMLCLSVF